MCVDVHISLFLSIIESMHMSLKRGCATSISEMPHHFGLAATNSILKLVVVGHVPHHRFTIYFEPKRIKCPVVCYPVSMCVCVCVCVRERERERESDEQTERQSQKERAREIERESERERAIEKERRERETETERACERD